MRRIIVGGALAAVVVALGLMAVVVVRTVLRSARAGPATDAAGALDWAASQVATPQPTPVLLSAAVVVRELRGASELTTAVYTLETVVDESQERRLGAFPLGRTQLLYIAHGQVRAGVDLDDLVEADVSIAPGVVGVRLPAPRIQDAKIDVNRSYTYDVRRSLLGPNSPDLQTRAERYALARTLQAACAEGILDDANDRAALAVTKLLEIGGDRRVTVETRPPQADACRLPEATPLEPARTGPAGADAAAPGATPAGATAPARTPGTPTATATSARG